MKYIYQLADRATKAIDDEKQARIDLNTVELEAEQVDGSLINKISELKGTHTTIVELESELKVIISGAA